MKSKLGSDPNCFVTSRLRAACSFVHVASCKIQFPDYAKAKALTDNGSEFKGHFAKRMSAHEVVHWKTYPKTPKMNAHCERFNRSIQESFVDYNEDLLFTDLALFNQKMSDWLVFYNTELPHLSTKPNPKKTASLTNLPVAPISAQVASTVQHVLDQYRTLHFQGKFYMLPIIRSI